MSPQPPFGGRGSTEEKLVSRLAFVGTLPMSGRGWAAGEVASCLAIASLLGVAACRSQPPPFNPLPNVTGGTLAGTATESTKFCHLEGTAAPICRPHMPSSCHRPVLRQRDKVLRPTHHPADTCQASTFASTIRDPDVTAESPRVRTTRAVANGQAYAERCLPTARDATTNLRCATQYLGYSRSRASRLRTVQCCFRIATADIHRGHHAGQLQR